MNKLFWSAVIINLALLAVFILLDFLTWNNVATGLRSLIQTIQDKGTLANMMWSNYAIFQVGISVGYFPSNYGFANLHDTVNFVNLLLIWFIVTIIVNLYMIWYSGIKRMSEPTKGSKTETISARQ